MPLNLFTDRQHWFILALLNPAPATRKPTPHYRILLTPKSKTEGGSILLPEENDAACKFCA